MSYIFESGFPIEISILKIILALFGDISYSLTCEFIHFTGLHIKKEYTSLGTSSPNTYTKSYCCLLRMHVCICMEMNLNVYTTTCWYTQQ